MAKGQMRSNKEAKKPKKEKAKPAIAAVANTADRLNAQQKGKSK